MPCNHGPAAGSCGSGHTHAAAPAALPIVEAVSTGLCAVLGVLAVVCSRSDFSGAANWTGAAATAAFLAGAHAPARNAFLDILRLELNVDLLMIVAAAGAVAIGDWGEGLVLLFLFSLSGTLEAFAMYRTTRSIEALVQLRPREALLMRDGHPDGEVVPVESLQVGDIVRVRPGERFSVDGVVVDGETWADEATLTGESEPIQKLVGSTVFASTINGQGSVLVKMTKAVADTTVERIIQMVQQAQAQKTPTQQFVEAWERPYVIGVLTVSLLVLLGGRAIHTTSWHDAFYHAMVLLVAASPCAVVVGAPAVMLSAIARAGLHGVLFKGAVHVEALGQVDHVAFDKTGTVTVGRPIVTETWVPNGADVVRLLGLAAAIERRSEHPLAVPVLNEVAHRSIPISDATITDFDSHTGLGVHGRVGDIWVGVGREELFVKHQLAVPPELLTQVERLRQEGQTTLLVVTSEPGLYGAIAVADQIRPEAAPTIDALKRMGIKQVIILSGDHARVASAVARKVHADDFRAGLLPDQKVVELQRLSAEGRSVAMVGDGVNDAPALATADVGIAMGGAGTDVALEVADVILMRDDLRGLPTAVWISKVARRRVRQNMAFAFAVIGILVVSTFANLPLWMGVLGHEGSTVIVVFNGLRLLWQKFPQA